MREIKFRAWIKSLEVMADVLTIDFEDETVVLKGYKRDTIASFDQIILLQYTGLKDKNGVEIYEGDILQAVDLFNGVIEYHPTRAQFIGRNVGKSYQGDVFDTLYTRDGTFRYSEVIGNIYENKELIMAREIENLIDQLDEPEKVVIPEWFAEFIEERLESTSDGDLVMDLWVIYYHGDFPVKHYNWLRNNKELATRAILDGYTIEQPKLLTVIVKDYDKTIMSKQLPEDEVNKMMEGLE